MTINKAARVAGVLTLALWPGPLLAQEAGSFQGLYVGGLLSQSNVDQDTTTTLVLSGFEVVPPPPPPPPPPDEEVCPPESFECELSGSTRASGLQGTLLLGYRAPLHHWGLLAGGEADVSFGKLDSEYEGYRYGADRLVTLRAVLGSEIHPGLFLFSTAGLGWLHATASDEDDGSSYGATVHGWVYGGGAELALGKHGGHDWLLRADYLMGQFKDWTFPTSAAVPGTPAPATPTLVPLFSEEVTVEPEILQIRVGATVKLGGP